MMKIGTYYYPEHWPREQWERDFDNIRSMGLDIVHMGEFAWFSLEPAAGRFEIDWLSVAVDLAAQRGLKVILSTPTAAPPIWLVDHFPEVLPIENLHPRGFGGRRHYSPTSPALHEAASRIVTALADRFGDHPAVIGWQIDNEYGGPYTTNEHTHASFRRWLARKYGSIRQLNAAWGCKFWNTYYTSFDQIQMPAGRDVRYANPHHHLDASRFWSWAFADFNALQARILRPKVGDRFITTNFMPMHLDCDPADMADHLSLYSWDSYPISGWEKQPTDQTFRIGDPNGIQMMHDHMASFNGRWALMELQPGQINWSGVPVLPYPGAIRLWIWTAFAHGAEFVTTYRYRQPLVGVEMFHHGLVGTDGVTPSAGGEEFAQAAREMKQLDLSKIPAPEEAADADTVGLLLDFEQLYHFNSLPQSRKWNQVNLLRMMYGAVAQLGLRVAIVHPNRPWPKNLKVLLAPAIQLIDAELVGKFERFTAGGGHLLLTCRTGLMDRHGHLWEGPVAKPILPLIGAQIPRYDVLPDDLMGKVQFAGKSYPWNIWGDQLEPDPGTQVLGTYADQYYAGTPAITRNRFAKGTVTYCGVFGSGDLIDAVVAQVVEHAGVAITRLPPRLRVLRRGPYAIALNYADRAADAPAPASAAFIVGTRSIEPAGVAVWLADESVGRVDA